MPNFKKCSVLKTWCVLCLVINSDFQKMHLEGIVGGSLHLKAEISNIASTFLLPLLQIEKQIVFGGLVQVTVQRFCVNFWLFCALLHFGGNAVFLSYISSSSFLVLFRGSLEIRDNIRQHRNIALLHTPIGFNDILAGVIQNKRNTL